MDRGQKVVDNLRAVLQRINEISSAKGVKAPRLVAVSKTFPQDLIQSCYDAGQRHFGENYAQELAEKAPRLTDSCPDIRWHFIGTLQTNKIRKLCGLPNLWCIETVSSRKYCDHIQTAVKELNKSLNVLIQVHTSEEKSKGGLEVREAPDLASHIVADCPNLKLLGLMTIGSLAESTSREKNDDFEKLRECRKAVSEKLGWSESDLELSMGMSGDYPLAIEYGSTNVRVGSTIFGKRTYAAK